MLKYLKDFLYVFLIGALCYIPAIIIVISFRISLVAGFISTLAILFGILIGLIVYLFIRGGRKNENIE